MEPVGLAVGLVGLFSTCMDVMQRVDSYRTAGRDSRQLDAQLNATMHLFERWGDGVGISKGKLSDNHHPDLDDPRTFAVVQGLLNSIKDFSTTSNEPPSPNGLQKTPSFPISGDVSSHGSKISRWQKTAWALRGKLKQTSHVQALAGLVSDLYNVVPPDTTGSKALTRNPSFRDLSISEGEQPYAVEIRELLQKIEEEMAADKMRDLHLWLGAPPLNDVFSDSNDKRVEETCEWILHRDEFLEWQKPSSSSKLLWIKGPAGFGKTFLCARIVQELERTAQGHVAYFFLSSRYDGRDDTFSVIRAWLTVMIQRSPAARDIVTKTRLLQHESRASQEIILRAFREVIMGVPGCVLILDGLDECTGLTNTDTKSVPNFLDKLRMAVADTTTKILISSRGDAIIQQGLSEFPGYSEYTIVQEDVGPDLMAYSSEIVRAKLPNKDEPTRTSIAQKMKSRSEGQFQWVKLQEGSLRKGRSRKQLEREIDETPSGLDSLYDREWNRINAMGESDKGRALSLLQWTAFARRPLTVYEITGAVLVTDDMDELPLDEMPDCVDQDYVDSMILELCGSLIDVRRVSSPESAESLEPIHESEEDSIGLQEVHLSHFSVKEYLLLKTYPGTNTLLSNEKLRLANEDLHNTILAKHCIRFINLPGALEGIKLDDKKRPKQHFVFYAADEGFEHCRDVRAIDLDLQQAIIALIDSRNENWPFLKEFFETGLADDAPEFQGSSISPFILALASGFTDAMAHLIREGSFDMEDRSFANRTPLFWLASSEHGSNGITELLISRGADVSVVDDKGITPLNLASESGNTEVVRQLIESGADVSHETPDGYTPLSMASSKGFLELAKLLIQEGADVNQVVANGYPPLLLAVWHNHTELAELLIDEGAEPIGIHLEGQMFSLLAVAAGSGYLNAAEALINRGFNPAEAQPLLLAASYGGYEGFSSDFDVKDADELPDFPRSDYHQVLELLLQSGADVNTSGVCDCTPLYLASFYGFIGVVDILLQSGAGLNVKTVHGATPLQVSSARGHFRVTQLLVQYGACVATKDNAGRNALHYACRSGNIELINLIINESQRQALDEADHWGSTPLSLAARFGSVGIVRALIGTGAVEVESSDKFGRTAASWATSLGHHAVSRLLAKTDGNQDLGTDIEEEDAVQAQSQVLRAFQVVECNKSCTGSTALNSA
ncbi:ankyrin repeat domain-containing protein [Fusarium napiforme]|uniref:Ankyrin repeat domain-containing protein n=1 Tax=Fusarium napiforme TaxID=42672 RepID=A0A8H5N4X3_9HYPO|nr:ankyrin repeat domain-containing protein [Fusarium napiforme]